MNNIIIGTAGHIDHGKTSLIRGLTGFNTDRLKEEQNRGISIDIGFSNIELPSGIKAGIVDVPGHEKFVKNMLAGIHGIDIALLIISADEGIMPQTNEHIEILNLLDIKQGIVVLTKIDMVEDTWADMIEEDLRESLKNTIFENSSIIRVSNHNKIGYNDLINEIDKLAQITDTKNQEINPVLPIDRSFSIQGHGTVVTGTLISGKLSLGDDIEIYPNGIRSKIRSIQVHDSSVEECYAGQRVAINLSNISKDDVVRGDILALPDEFIKTNLISVKIKSLNSLDKPINNRTRIRLYVGTKEVLGRIVFLDKEELRAGESSYCQILLEEEIVVKYNDKFILRFYSPISNLGGGVILNPHAKKLKRFSDEAIKNVSLLDNDNIYEVIYHVVENSEDIFVSMSYLRMYFNMKKEDIKEILEENISKKLIKEFKLLNTDYYVGIEKYNDLSSLIYDEIEKYHLKYPLKIGKKKEEIRNKYFSGVNIKLFEQYLENMSNDGTILQDKEYISLSNHKVTLSGEEEEISKLIITRIEKDKYMLPKLTDLMDELKLEKDQFYSVLEVLKINQDVFVLDEDYVITKKQYNVLVDTIKKYLNDNETIEVGEFRDLIGVNRKISISILEYLDKTKVTKRRENVRVLY